MRFIRYCMKTLVSKELLVIRFRNPVLVAAAAVVVLVVGFSHSAGAAPRPAATASPVPAPAPTATPEPLDVQIPRLEAVIKANPNDKDSTLILANDYLEVGRADQAAQLTQQLLKGGSKIAVV